MARITMNKVSGYYDYDIFGSPITGNYTTGADYGYLGKPYDSITGLYNYGYRDYSPHTVRFTTVDPIRDEANWFAYVNNDPVNYVDLWGLDTFQIGGSVAGGAGTGGTIGGGIVVSWNPSDRIVGVGFYGTYEMGSHMGTSGSLTLDISTSKNNTTKEVGGQSLTTGGEVSVGTSLSAEISVSLDGAAPIKTISIGKGIGGSDVHSYYTYTSVSSIVINVGKALDVVKEFISTTITAVRSWGFGGKSD